MTGLAFLAAATEQQGDIANELGSLGGGLSLFHLQGSELEGELFSAAAGEDSVKPHGELTISIPSNRPSKSMGLSVMFFT